MRQVRNKGATLAEALIVVAIILILSSLIFVGVGQYQRSTHQLEMDGAAKEIFIAAQNHLSIAESQNFHGAAEEDFGHYEGDGVYYFVVTQGVCDSEHHRVLDMMLPAASIEEKVRLTANYVIRYRRSPAVVLDVFCSTAKGTRFGHDYRDGPNYASLISEYRFDENASKRRSCGDEKSVLGYYGGVAVEALETITLQNPSVFVHNGETLWVEINDPNVNNPEVNPEDLYLSLIVTGETSGKQYVFEVVRHGTFNLFSTSYAEGNSITGSYRIVLDDITESGLGFDELFTGLFNDLGESGSFYPGENIRVQAVSFSNSALANIAYSAEARTSSLFAGINEERTVSIANARHLENLGENVSGFRNDLDGDNNADIVNAKQISDISWSDFKLKTDGESTRIYCRDGGVSAAGTFIPADPYGTINYDGGMLTVSDVKINIVGGAGLFSELVGGKVENVELVDFSVVSQNGKAGALAAYAENVEISGVLVHNDNARSDAALEIRGRNTSGGLVGSINGGSVTASAAAVYVKSTESAAGGLAGKAENAEITDSYSGGHTKDGRYLSASSGAARINVSGTISGGLVGQSVSTSVTKCYSTCSATGTVYAGGLIGSAESGGVSGSFSTGAVFGDYGKTGAFAGLLSGTAVGTNEYYGIINEGMEIAAALSGGTDVTLVSEFDSRTDAYDGYIEQTTAFAYDSSLVAEYKGKSDMPGVSDLDSSAVLPDFMNNHYGDWPSPQTLVVNTKATRAAAVSSKGTLKVSNTAVNTVTIDYTESAGLPDGAVLSADKIMRGTADYEELYKSLSMLGADQVIRSAEFIDISILEGGREIEPEDTVNVTLNLANGQDGRNLTVIHFGETPEAASYTVNNGVISFGANSFSVYAIIEHDGNVAVKNPRVQFHFLSQEFTSETVGLETTYNAGYYRFVNKGGTEQTSQILKSGESLEMINNPPNIRVGQKVKYFFGWYAVEFVSEGTDAESGEKVVTYKWSDEPEELNFEKPLSIGVPAGGFKVGDEVTWMMNGVTGTAVLDGEGTAHVYLAPIYEDYYFVNYHLGARDSGIWGTIMHRKLIVLGKDQTAIVHIGSMTAPSTDATRQVFSGWETVETVTEQATDEGVPLWLDALGNEVAQATCPEGGEAITYDRPIAQKQLFLSVDPITGNELDGTYKAGDGSHYTPAQTDDGYYIAVSIDDLDPDNNSLDLYPVFAQARWIRYNTGKSGNKATYVPSQYLLTSDFSQNDNYESPYYVTSLPEGDQPQRNGYELLGWYADAALDPATGDITNLTEARDVTFTREDGTTYVEHITARQITNGSGAIVSGDFQRKITDGGDEKLLYEVKDGKLYLYEELESLTLYARWKEIDDTTYSVLVWKQKVTDSVYATDDEKTYDYSAEDSAIDVSGRSGKTLAQLRSDGSLTAFEGKSITGFNCSTARTTMNTGTVAGDGSTVINVYYDRNVHSLTFQASTSSYSYTATTGTTTPQYAFSDGEALELIRVGDAAPYTWAIPEYGYRYNENPEGGYVRVGDEYVPLVPINSSSTTYVLTDTLTGGDDYLIVSRNSAGAGYALGHSGTSVVSDAVTVNTGSPVYISASDVDETSVWTVSGPSNSNYTFVNGGYYIRGNGNSLNISTTNSGNTWRWTGTNNRLRFRNGVTNGYYLRYNNGFSLSNAANSIYLYKKTTTTVVTGYTYDNNGTPVVYTNEQRYSYDYQVVGNTAYNGTRYTRTGPTTTSNHIVYVIEALYQQNISKNFPIPGFTEGERWQPQSSVPYSQVLVYIDIMPNYDVTFRSNTSTATEKVMHFYVEPLPGVEATRTYNGKGFVEYRSISAKYNFFTEAEDYIDLVGFTKYAVEGYRNGTQTSTIWGSSNGATEIYCYYLRDSETFTYRVNYPNVAGLTYTGSGSASSDHNETVPYESSLSGYDVRFTPHAPDHYIFQGWFEDAAGTVPFNFNSTMPAGDKIVYAGWKAEKFRIDIDPNGGEIDHINHNYSNPAQGYNDYWFNADGDAVFWDSSASVWKSYDPETKKFTVLTDPSKYGVTPLSTFNRTGDSDYHTDRSTYFNGTYNELVGYYDMDGLRQYVEISDTEANNLGTGNWYYYLNTQHKETDGSSLPSDLRNALYITEAEVTQYYNFYKDWVEGNLQGGYISGTSVLGIEVWKNTYLKKSANGSFQKYRRLYDNESYTFLGWYKIYYDDEGNEIGPGLMPYNFADPITGPLTIRAYWRLDGGYRILYTPYYTMPDGTVINGRMDAWTDPQVASTTYADSAKTNVYRQPTGITANNSEEDGKDYIFRGWQLVSVRSVNGTEIYTPLENNVYYDPGAVFTISAGYADANGIIHFRAVYERKVNSYRRPDVVSITLDANTGFITGDGVTNPENGSDSYSWDGTGSVYLDYDDAEEKIVFGYLSDADDHFQTGHPLHLYKYSTTLTRGDETGRNYFKHGSGYLLIGFDDEPNEGDCVASYPADSIISVQRSEHRTIYAVWEPMVYINFFNNTDKTITFSLSSDDGALTIVNAKNGLYGREAVPLADLASIEIDPGETLMYAVPDGSEKTITVSVTNELGIGKVLTWDTSLTVGSVDYDTMTGDEPIVYHHGEDDDHTLAKGRVNNNNSASFDERLIVNQDGITVTFDNTESDYALVLENNFTDGGYQEYDYTLLQVNSGRSQLLPSSSTRPGGYQFMGWAYSADATEADFSATKPVGDPWKVPNLYELFNTNPDVEITTVVTNTGGEPHTLYIARLYAVWKINKDASTVFVFKDVPLPGRQDVPFVFTYSMYGEYTWKKSVSQTYNTTFDDNFTFELYHGDHAVLITDKQTKFGYVRTDITVYKADGSVRSTRTCTVQADEGKYGDGGVLENELYTVTETPVEYYTTTVMRTAQTDDYSLYVGTSSDASTVPLELETNTVHWNTTFAGGTLMYTNDRQTVDVPVAKVLTGMNVSKQFPFEARYYADGRYVDLGAFSVQSGSSTTLEKIPVGADLYVTERGADLTDYVTTATYKGAGAALAGDSVTEGGNTVYLRTATLANVTTNDTLTFTNEFKSVKVKIIKRGFDGTNWYDNVESQFRLSTGLSNVFSGRYTTPVTGTSPRGNVVFETGKSYGSSAPDPVLYIGDYTISETNVYGNYIKLDDEIGFSVYGTESGVEVEVDADKIGRSVTCEKNGDVWEITVINRKTRQVKVFAGLLDPMIDQRTFSFVGGYVLDGTAHLIDRFELLTIATPDGFVLSGQEPHVITVPIGSTDLVIEEETSNITAGTDTIATTYDTYVELNDGGRVEEDYYRFDTVASEGELNVTFYNVKKTVDITVAKRVETEDKSGAFEFTATLSYNGPICDYPIFINATPADPDDDEKTNGSGEYSFVLEDGESTVITVPVGARLAIRETGVSGNATGDLEPYSTGATVKRTESGTDFTSSVVSFDSAERQFSLSSAPSAALTVTFVNSDGAKDVSFIKNDGFGDTLGGARFSLYKDTACTQLVQVIVNDVKVNYAESESTGASKGAVNFKVAPGIYYMKEINVPAGRELNSFVYRVTVGTAAASSAGIPLPDGQEYRIDRLKTDGSIVLGSAPDIDAYGVLNVSTARRRVILKKITPTYDPVAGAEFEILRYDRTNVTGVNTDGFTSERFRSSENGVFYVGELPYGVYYLHETTVPDGYVSKTASGNWYILTVSESGVGYRQMPGGEFSRKILAENSVPR